MKRRFGFSKEIMLLLVSICTICIGVTTYIATSMMEDMAFNLVQNNLEALTLSTYNQIDSSVNTSIKNYLRAIADKNLDIIEELYHESLRGEITESEARERIDRIVQSQRIGDSGYIYIVDSTGLLKSHPFISGDNVEEYDFIKNQIEQKHGYLEYLWQNPSDEKAREKVLFMSYFEPLDYIISISTYKSEFNNLVKISDFRDNILSIPLGETGYMYVMDSTGKLIIHPLEEGTNIYESKDSKDHYYIKEIIENKSGSIIYLHKNPGDEKMREKIVNYQYYEAMDWYICSGFYIEELTKPFYLLKIRILFISIALILVAVIISITYSKFILRPIHRLIAAMTQAKQGSYDNQLIVDQHDEIGKLTLIFNEMISQIGINTKALKESNLMLEEANLTLETKVNERTEQLAKLSNLDGLTGIANRRRLDEFFDEQLQICKRELFPLSLILLDIDYFKYYNDTYGHPEGDKCLKKITTALNNSINRSTDLVGRYGGEEFALVIMNTQSEGAVTIAKKIHSQIKALQIEHKTSDVSEYVTVSMGVATIMDVQNYTIEDIYRLSDQALYKAKHNGRNKSEHSIIGKAKLK